MHIQQLQGVSSLSHSFIPCLGLALQSESERDDTFISAFTDILHCAARMDRFNLNGSFVIEPSQSADNQH